MKIRSQHIFIFFILLISSLFLFSDITNAQTSGCPRWKCQGTYVCQWTDDACTPWGTPWGDQCNPNTTPPDCPPSAPPPPAPPPPAPPPAPPPPPPAPPPTPPGPPPPSGQGLGQILINGTSCIAAGTLAPWLSDKIWGALSRLMGGLSSKLSTWLFSELVVPVGDHNAYKKERVYDVAARCFAREIMDSLGARIIGAVRTSGRGNSIGRKDPAFVRDWRKFKIQAQHRGENIFRSVLGSTEICPYFSGNIKSAFNANNQPDVSNKTSTRAGNLDPFTRRARCTMPRGWSIRSLEQNFTPNGGWGALMRLSEPQNNFYGTMLMSLSELAVQRALEEDSDQQEAGPTGFTARRGGSAQENCLLTASNRQCVVYKDILTPGSILQQSTSALIAQELAWVTNADELHETLGALTRLLLNRILNLSKPDYTDQEAFDPELYEGSRPDPDLPDQGPTPTSPECSDTRDNDLDGLFDFPDDPDCTDANDPTESGSGVPGLFCTGDADGDNNTCESYLGEDVTTCPADCYGAPVTECDNATDTNGDGIADTGDDDGDGLVDAPGLGWINGPDPGCSSPFDNSELDTVITTQCTDGIDNDGDGQADFAGAGGLPADSDCSSATDNSEISYIVNLCSGTNSSGTCQPFQASCPNLATCVNPTNPSFTVGDNNAESIVAGAINLNVGFIVNLCLDPNFGNCTRIASDCTGVTGACVTIPNGTISDLSTVPTIGNNAASSIEIIQP